MRSQLERAINLAAKTGDKIIVVDELNDRSSVVMSLAEYEKLLNGQNKASRGVKNLTEEELLDKINHDIVSWKDANLDRNFTTEIPRFHDLWEDEEDNDAEDELSFAKSAEDEEDDEPIELAGADDEEDEEDEETDIFPDITAPSFDSDGNLIAEPEAEIATESKVEKKEEPEENLYYYSEPESAFAKAAADKEDSGFTSIKDELKNKKHWEIPEEAKKKAADMPF